jgi:hypothetical protein
MPRYFFDTSALVKRYHAESGTPEVRRLLTEPGAECVISRLATVEMLSGFAGNVRTGVFSTAAFTRLCDTALLEGLTVVNPEQP